MKKIKTTEYYGSLGINYKTIDHCGQVTRLVIFSKSHTRLDPDFRYYYRNNKTGYCKDEDGKRIAAALFETLEATCSLAL